MKKILRLFAIISIFIIPQVTLADDFVDYNAPIVFVMGLYYDHGQIYIDKNYQSKYDLINDTFKPQLIGENFYIGEVVNQNNQVLAQFKFDPTNNTNWIQPDGNPVIQIKLDSNFQEGSIVVEAPYSANATKINFFDKIHKSLASVRVNLQENDICNQDNICESSRGESLTTCPNDCSYFPITKIRPTETPSQTPIETRINVSNPPVSIQPTPSTIPPPSRSIWEIILPLAIWFGLAIAVVVGWFLIKRRRSTMF